MKPWSHLPNASHIDWVIESLKTNPRKWDAAWTAARGETWYAAWNAACDAACDAALSATRDAAWTAARTMVLNAALSATWNASRSEAWEAAWISARVTLAALVAYDDCDQYLNMSYDELLIYAVLSERPQVVLLLPLKWIQEHECLVTPA